MSSAVSTPPRRNNNSLPCAVGALVGSAPAVGAEFGTLVGGTTVAAVAATVVAEGVAVGRALVGMFAGTLVGADVRAARETLVGAGGAVTCSVAGASGDGSSVFGEAGAGAAHAASSPADMRAHANRRMIIFTEFLSFTTLQVLAISSV
jgi:hypothetical protein